MNPNLRYGQAIPGVTDGRGIGLIDTRELSSIADAVGLLRPSRAWTASDDRAMQGVGARLPAVDANEPPGAGGVEGDE